MTYRIDCFRDSQGEPLLDNGNPYYRPWLVVRVADGAVVAQCLTRVGAELALARRANAVLQPAKAESTG